MRSVKYTLMFLCMHLFCTGQIITTETEETTIDASGLSFIHSIDETISGNHMYDFYIHNDTEGKKKWKITRKIISETSGWSNYLCWADLCYAPNPELIWHTSSVSIAPGESMKLSNYLNAPVEGNAHYRYYVTNDLNHHLDSVDVTVNFSLDIQDIKSDHIQIYPNPVSEFFRIEGIEGPFGVKLLSSSGKVVKELKSTSNNLNIDTKDLKPGFYFVDIYREETGHTIRKIIITQN